MDALLKRTARVLAILVGLAVLLYLVMPVFYTHVPRARIDGTRLLGPLELLATQVAELRQDRGLDGIATAIALPPSTGDWMGAARWWVDADGAIGVEAPATGLRIEFVPVLSGGEQVGWRCEFTPAEHRPSVGRCAGERR